MGKKHASLGKTAAKPSLIGIVVACVAALITYLSQERGNVEPSSPAQTAQVSSERGQAERIAGGKTGSSALLPKPGDDFDYYVLALSWSPSYCKSRPDADQCGQGKAFIVHGLWPQHERGYPQDCPTNTPRPPRSLMERYADLTESVGLLGYQWRKHGACAGMPPQAYFATMRAATERVAIPKVLEQLRQDRQISPKVAEAAFLEANPQMRANGVTVTCKDRRLAEIRICLTKDLKPRKCGADVSRDCPIASIELPAPAR
ncbi:MAG: ribonuclease T2 [Neomegalonema sp.]|nr:ribonuclease T2 [Neomegalonema sp.]